MTSFPLIRLPNLAREKVIREMDVREQYFLSTLSKIARRATKISIRYVSYSLDVQLEPEVTHWTIEKDGTYERFCLLFNGETREHSLETLEFFNEQFKFSTIVLTCLQLPNDFVQQFLEAARILRIEIDELSVTSDDPDQSLFEYIKENSLNLDYCHISDSPWLCLNHLTRLFMDCRYFKTTDSEHQMKYEDFSQFVKFWMENDSKLEFVGIDANEFIDMRIVLRDVEKEEVQRAYIEEAEETFNVGDAYKVRQKSGKEAVVCNSQWQFTLTTNFNDEEEDWDDVEEEEEVDEDINDVEVEEEFNNN